MFSGKRLLDYTRTIAYGPEYWYTHPMIMSISAAHRTCNVFNLYFYTAYAARYFYIAMQRNLKKYRNLVPKT